MDTDLTLVKRGRWAVKRIAEALGIARSNLLERLKARAAPRKEDTLSETDTGLLGRIRELM